MAVLGKRKASEPSISQEDADAIFRRHFEAQFAPIDAGAASSSSQRPTKKNKSAVADGSSDEDDDEDDGSEDGSEEEDEYSDGAEDNWDGLSDDMISDQDFEEDDDDEPNVVEVVDHSTSNPITSSMSKQELKAFMSSRPPDQTTKPTSTTTSTPKSSTTLPEDAPSLLAQDLELRRLLSESHLLASPSLSLSSSTAGGTGKEDRLFSSGRIRHKATDLRAQALGSKTSLFVQEKTPMLVRKMQNASKDRKETKRRREAAENGIVLERPTGKKGRERKRGGGHGGGGGIDRPGMGRMRGAELKISDRDVRQIEGSRDAFGRRGGKRGKRR